MSTLQDHKVVTIMKFSGNIKRWFIKLETIVKSKKATLQNPEVKCKHGLTIWTNLTQCQHLTLTPFGLFSLVIKINTAMKVVLQSIEGDIALYFLLPVESKTLL